MKENLMPGIPEIVPLSQDLEKIFKIIFSKTGHILTDFSRESENPVLMNDKCSHVLDLDTEEVINIFNVEEHHYLLTPEQVLRIGLTANLCFYNLLALVLKAMWEKHLFCQVEVSCDRPFHYVETITNEELIFEHTPSFQPESANIFNLLESYDHLAMIHGESAVSLGITIKEFILNKLHVIDNQLILKYLERRIKEKEIQDIQDVDQNKEEFERLKFIFLSNHQAIETLLFDQFRIAKEIEHVKTRYYQRFPIKDKFLEVLFKKDLLSIKIRLKIENPELTENELSAKTEQLATDFYKRLVEIQTFISRGKYTMQSATMKMDSSYEASYRNKIRIALRTAFLLLHPDMISKSMFEKLNEYQRSQLNLLWNELMEHKETFNYDPSMLLYSLPDLGEIQRIIEKAKSIISFGDSEIYPEYLIQGDTFLQKIEFLKVQNSKLNEHIITLQIQIQSLMNDEEFQLYSNILSFEKNIERHEKDLNNGIESLKVQISAMEKQLSELFNS